MGLSFCQRFPWRTNCCRNVRAHARLYWALSFVLCMMCDHLQRNRPDLGRFLPDVVTERGPRTFSEKGPSCWCALLCNRSASVVISIQRRLACLPHAARMPLKRPSRPSVQSWAESARCGSSPTLCQNFAQDVGKARLHFRHQHWSTSGQPWPPNPLAPIFGPSLRPSLADLGQTSAKLARLLGQARAGLPQGHDRRTSGRRAA